MMMHGMGSGRDGHGTKTVGAGTAGDRKGLPGPGTAGKPARTGVLPGPHPFTDLRQATGRPCLSQTKACREAPPMLRMSGLPLAACPQMQKSLGKLRRRQQTMCKQPWKRSSAS